MNDDDFISLQIRTRYPLIDKSIIVNKNSSITDLIFLMSNEIQKEFPDYSNQGYFFFYKYERLAFNSNTLKSLNFQNSDTILLIEFEDTVNYNDSNLIKSGLISINLVSYDRAINKCFFVNKKLKCSELILLMEKIIGFSQEFSNFATNGVFYLHNGKKLIFNSQSLESLNFKDKDLIYACRVEDQNIIKDDGILIDYKKPEDLISVVLISMEFQTQYSFFVNKTLSAKKLIRIFTTKILEKYPKGARNKFIFLYEGRKLPFSSNPICDLGVKDDERFLAIEIEPLFNEDIDLDIRIIMDDENNHKMIFDFNLSGLLKFCLVKDISIFTDRDPDYYIPKLPKKIKYILEVVEGGNIDLNQTQNSIMSVLKKFEGINIVNFSKFIDISITKEELLAILNIFKLQDRMEIQKEINCLVNYSEYMDKFEKEFDLAKKNSVFEWRITSMTIVDRKQLHDFETSKKNCPNRINRILFHGTGIEPSSKILIDMFKRSEKSGYQFGKGVYFTDFLDYAWYYGGKTNRANVNKIPNVDENFILVGSYIYYDENKKRRVFDHRYTPKKNEMNYAFADSMTRTIYDQEPNKNRFYGTEYVIFDYDQICPFLGCSLKREEFCVIWRDKNFSPNPVYNNKFDEIFKKFLEKRMAYIQEEIKFNVYTCDTSEEALKIVNRKKYNKIILISNVGDDLSGRQFVMDARKIIGNDVITLFLCYNIQHLYWIKDFKNALFSNDPQFYENYLQSFMTNSELNSEEKENQIKFQLGNLIIQVQKKYKVKFNFDSNFLYYPKFKKEGLFSDLTF